MCMCKDVYVDKILRNELGKEWLENLLLRLTILLNDTIRFRILNFLSILGATFLYMFERLNASDRTSLNIMQVYLLFSFLAIVA